MAVDATEDDGTFGRLINHSSNSPNLSLKVLNVNGQPVIVFTAMEEIPAHQELHYNYGENRKAVLDEDPWLR